MAAREPMQMGRQIISSLIAEQIAGNEERVPQFNLNPAFGGLR
jgi:hypothetical protein